MSAIKILQRNSLFIKLTIILMLGAVVGEGLQDILIQYLQLKMGFRANDVVRSVHKSELSCQLQRYF